jgi:hypothetical protein
VQVSPTMHENEHHIVLCSVFCTQTLQTSEKTKHCRRYHCNIIIRAAVQWSTQHPPCTGPLQHHPCAVHKNTCANTHPLHWSTNTHPLHWSTNSHPWHWSTNAPFALVHFNILVAILCPIIVQAAVTNHALERPT